MKSRKQLVLENKIRKMVREEIENTTSKSNELKNATNKLLKLIVANDIIPSNLREKTIINLKAIQQLLAAR